MGHEGGTNRDACMHERSLLVFSSAPDNPVSSRAECPMHAMRSLQNLADSGFKFSELAGAEELAVEGAGDAEGDVAEEAPRGHGEARRRGGARRRGNVEEERGGKPGRRKKKTSAWKKQSAYAPD